jgi:hypothetical protein
MDIELSPFKNGVEERVKLPIDGSAVVVTGQAKLEAIGNPDSKIFGEWFGRRSHWLRSAIKRGGKRFRGLIHFFPACSPGIKLSCPRKIRCGDSPDASFSSIQRGGVRRRLEYTAHVY